MAAEQSEAIVLRVWPWSETSLIASLYTREFGKLSVLAKGARRPKSPFEAARDLLSICRVVFIPKAGDTLDLLTEAKLQQRFRAGSRDLLRLYAGYYAVELLDQLTDKGDPQPAIYDLAVASIHALAEPDAEVAAVVLRLELQMLRQAGHLPSWRYCGHCGREVEDRDWVIFSPLASGVVCDACQVGARQMIRLPGAARLVLQRFSEGDWTVSYRTGIGREQRAAIRGVMTRYLTALLDRKLQMHSYLEELGR